MPQAVTRDEAQRRGQTALDFYRELRDRPGDDYEYFGLPAPSAARANRGVVARVQRLLHSLFAP